MKKFVLITGAAGCIGSELINGLSKNGWEIIGTDNNGKAPNEEAKNKCFGWIFQDLNQLNGNQIIQKDFQNKVANILGVNKLNCIINNAAIQRIAPFKNLSDSDWINTFNVNFFAALILSKLFLEDLIANKGTIINISSIHANLTKENFTSYSCSKAALNALTKSMAVEIGAKVRVNAIEPAAIKTKMLEESFSFANEKIKELSKYHPSGNIGNPNDVLNAVLYLINPDNTFLNGCIIPLGGGIHSKLHDPF